MRTFGRLMVVLAFFLVCGWASVGASAATNNSASLTANLPVIPGKEASTSIMIENKDNRTHRYKLSTQGLPADFKAWFMRDGSLVDSLELKSSEKCAVEFHLSAPVEMQSDSFAFTINLPAEDGSQAVMPLSLTVSRDYALQISGGVNNLETMSGQSISVDIPVTNTGSKELKDLYLKAELPYKWLLDGTTPDKLTLKPGEYALFKLRVTVPPSQTSGNFSIKITTSNENTTSNEVVIPVVVKTGMGFAWWMLGFVLAAAIITGAYFRKKGRR